MFCVANTTITAPVKTGPAATDLYMQIPLAGVHQRPFPLNIPEEKFYVP
jgi:hypothetical protein